MDSTNGQFLLMPVEAADAAFVDCLGAALLLNRLYNTRCYRTGKAVLDIGEEARSMGRHRNSIGNWWRELRSINKLLGMPFFDDYEVADPQVTSKRNIEPHGKEGIAIWLKAAGRAGGEGSKSQNIVRENGAQNIVHENGAQNIVREHPEKGMATPQFEQLAAPNRLAAQGDAQSDAQDFMRNTRLDQEISNSGSNTKASKLASPPARTGEGGNAYSTQTAQGASEAIHPQVSSRSTTGEQGDVRGHEADELEAHILELTGFATLPAFWQRQIGDWRLARYPAAAFERLFEWAWEVRASEGRVPGRGAMSKTLRAIARELQEGQGHDKQGAAAERPPRAGQPNWRGRGDERAAGREPETLAELKRRVRAQRAGVARR